MKSQILEHGSDWEEGRGRERGIVVDSKGYLWAGDPD